MLYSDTLECPCSQRIIPYKSLISISPTLHQICSSDFVTDRWLSIVANITDYVSVNQDWRNRAYAQFSLLSQICQLANQTINEYIRKFHLQSLVVTDLLSENEFNTQFNSILNEFFDSALNSFVSSINIIDIISQVDQFYKGFIALKWTAFDDTTFIANISINNLTNVQLLAVIMILSQSIGLFSKKSFIYRQFFNQQEHIMLIYHRSIVFVP